MYFIWFYLQAVSIRVIFPLKNGEKVSFTWICPVTSALSCTTLIINYNFVLLPELKFCTPLSIFRAPWWKHMIALHCMYLHNQCIYKYILMLLEIWIGCKSKSTIMHPLITEINLYHHTSRSLSFVIVDGTSYICLYTYNKFHHYA